MSLREHIAELRRRLFLAMLGVLVGMIVGWLVHKRVMDIVNAPYCDRFPEGEDCRFVGSGPGTYLILELKVSLYVGIILSCPLWLYQLWAFVAPGLYRKEKRWTYIFVAVASPLFLAGAGLAYIVVAKGLDFLLPAKDSGLSVDVNISDYFDFFTGMLLVFGVAFEFPLAVFLLNLAGVVSAKRLLGWWRTVIFGIFVFTAVVTPTPDPFGMTALALPMVLLYFVAVGASALNDRRRARKAAAGPEVGDDELSPL
jgi:sec-independent protein translocase protein TatC